MRKTLDALDLPPVWLVVFMGLAWAISYLPVRLFGTAAPVLGAVVVLSGAGLVIAGALTMRRAKTTIVPRSNPSSLVTSGVFGFSRNPIYLGDALVLLGVILWWDAPLALPLVGLFVWLIQKRFILDEEARLTLAFGREYDLWAQTVHRWVGRRKSPLG